MILCVDSFVRSVKDVFSTAASVIGPNLEVTEDDHARVLVVLLLQFVLWINAIPCDLGEKR